MTGSLAYSRDCRYLAELGHEGVTSESEGSQWILVDPACAAEG